MNRARRIAVYSSGVALLGTYPVAVACPDDVSPSSCVCPEDMTLAPVKPVINPLRTQGAPPPSSPLATTTIHVFNFDFSINPPEGEVADATINLGDTVHWVWDSGFHSVTSLIGSAEVFDTQVQVPGFTFDHTFNQTGVFTYYCTAHGFDNGDGTAFGMVGTVTVAAPTSSWNVDFDGSWNTASNWTNSTIPNGAGHIANFGSVISGPRGVNVDSPVTVGTLNFDSPSPKSYLIAGGSTLTVQGFNGGNTAINVNSGNHTITTKLNVVNDVTFNVAQASSTLTVPQLQPTAAAVSKSGSGTLVVNNVRAASLNISGGTVAVASNGGDTGTSRVGALTLAAARSAPAVTLDLKNNDLQLTAASLSDVKDMIVAARNGGAWNQPGLTSSAAKSDAAQATGLGVISGADYKTANGATATFDSFTVSNSDVLVKYTWYGDSDFNGKVDGADYARIDTTFNQETSTHTDIGGWFNGDFDLNGKVDGADYAMIDSAFNAQTGTLRNSIGSFDLGGPFLPPGMTTVPEPTLIISLGWLAASAASMRPRRRASRGAHVAPPG